MAAKKHSSAERERTERRFAGDLTHASTVSVIGGCLGAFVLGAGVYGKWISDPSVAVAPVLIGIGALALGAALWFADAGVLPIRIGDAGVGVERNGEIVRVLWCDLERVFVNKDELVAKGKDLALHLPLGAHAAAAAFLLSEGVRRVPNVIDVAGSVADRLPKPQENQGEKVAIETIQVTGRPCAASGKPLTFERDARLCPVCAQVYHKDQVPKLCVTCKAELAGHSIAL